MYKTIIRFPDPFGWEIFYGGKGLAYKLTVKAAAYIRVSTDEQADHGISIPAQKSRLIAFCQAQGWDLYDFFIDEGYSGKDLNRPAIKRLLEEAGENKLDAVVVLKLDRLSRRQKDVLYLLEDVFDPLGIGFKSVTETFDTTTPFGKAALGMMAVFAQLERETIVERVRLAKKESARQGRFMGGPAPFGYLYNNEKKCLEIDETAAQTITRIYDGYLNEGRGYQKTAEDLERQGVPGPCNTRWSKNYIRKILANPVYAGIIGHKGILYQSNHQPIIDPDKWHTVQALIREKGSLNPGGASHSALLSGIIWCGQCGARMRSKNVWQNFPCTSPKKVTRYYVCYSQDGSARHMARWPGCKCGYKRADEIENRVAGELINYSFKPELLSQAAGELLSEYSGEKLGHLLTQATREIALADKKLERWLDAFERGDINSGELAVRVSKLRDQKAFLKKSFDQLEMRKKKEAAQRVEAGEILGLLQNFPAVWEAATAAERREVAVNLIKSVHVYQNGGVRVEFNS